MRSDEHNPWNNSGRIIRFTKLKKRKSGTQDKSPLKPLSSTIPREITTVRDNHLESPAVWRSVLGEMSPIEPSLVYSRMSQIENSLEDFEDKENAPPPSSNLKNQILPCPFMEKQLTISQKDIVKIVPVFSEEEVIYEDIDEEEYLPTKSTSSTPYFTPVALARATLIQSPVRSYKSKPILRAPTHYKRQLFKMNYKSYLKKVKDFPVTPVQQHVITQKSQLSMAMVHMMFYIMFLSLIFSMKSIVQFYTPQQVHLQYGNINEVHRTIIDSPQSMTCHQIITGKKVSYSCTTSSSSQSENIPRYQYNITTLDHTDYVSNHDNDDDTDLNILHDMLQISNTYSDDIDLKMLHDMLEMISIKPVTVQEVEHKVTDSKCLCTIHHYSAIKLNCD